MARGRHGGGIISFFFGQADAEEDSAFRVPERVARRLLGTTVRNWDHCRQLLNKAVADDLLCQARFSADDLMEMRAGRNPWASEHTRGSRKKMEWDHVIEIRDGMDPYVLSNLRLLPPAGHIRKFSRIGNIMCGSYKVPVRRD